MIGIYKITSPSKRVYIGQSTSIEQRFSYYKRLNCKSQKILYNSFLKYGVDKHKFEILCECEISELNERERFYQDLYSAIGISGMNCILTKGTDRSGKLSDETRLKLSQSRIGMKFSESHKRKIVIARKGRKHSYETRKKMSIAKSNISDETKIKMSLNNANSKIVLDTQTGIFYDSVKEVSDLYGFKHSTLRGKLSGYKKNNTQFIYA